MEKQEEEAVVNSEMYRPCLHHEEEVSRGFDDSAQGVELMSVDQCKSTREMDDSRLVGAPVILAGDAEVLARQKVQVQMVVGLEAVRSAAPRNSEESIRKPRRGRPPRIQRRSTPAQPPPRRRRDEDEEDVCFICFDGGSLVLCDRRGCPKAYHPACIKRDESFFRSKAKWNCGWHICSSCQKASHYMCYTCTFSLCKVCTKDADYLCVRGNKGFCGTCIRTVMLIENIPIGNKEAVQVDFDDKGSWEYLFKVYWIYVKQKLSLTLEELTKAKNPCKTVVALPPKVESPGGFCNNNDAKVCSLDNSCRNLEANKSTKRKTRNHLNQDFGGFGKSGGDGGKSLSEGVQWATKDLLEFVAHMKNGDGSMLSQFDVQALLLEYVKRNNLRDPCQKSQIICDSRLINLFGKERVGHFEMLKLLEYHFLIKENVAANKVADLITGNGEAAESNDNQLMINNHRKRKTRKKSDERGVQSNPNEYAAIDVHNINLLYLKRNLMENLIDDAESFHNTVSGSIVRIRIHVGDQKQDMYRLVQVVGTSKVAESYKVGTRTTDVMLEILNLDKKEVVSIDVISNQEFSEDECKRLRQSIKCGLIKRLTVGEIQKKAIAFRAVRVKECLEAEVLKLNHLRDRASEKGHRKELRECVEKLELLNSLEERQRRLHEIPEVHADPSMNPSYESEEDDGKPDKKKQDDLVRLRKSVVARKIVEEKSPGRGGGVFDDIGSRALKIFGTAYDQSRNTRFYVDKDGTTLVHEPVHASTLNQGGESFGSNNWTPPKNQVGPASSVTSTWNNQAALQSEMQSRGASESSLPPCSTATELSVHDFEREKLWHYQDPAGNIQGPFSMLQLRKWRMSGHFPSDLRVWRINEKQEDSILLSDALDGQNSKVSICNNHLLPADVRVPSDGAHKIVDAQMSENTDATWVDNEKVEVTCSSMPNDTSIHNNSDNESAWSNRWGSHSSSWTGHAHPVICNQQTEGSLKGSDLPKGIESRADQPQSCTSLPSSTPFEELRLTPSLQVRKGCKDEKWNASQDSVTINPPKTTGSQSSIADGNWKQADGESYSGQASSGQGQGCPSINSSSNGWVSGSSILSLTMSLERSQQKQEIHFPDPSSPTPKHNQGGLEGQATENKQSMSLSVHVLDSGPRWSATSSLLGGELQLPEVPVDGFGGSTTQTKPSVEWGSNLVSSSSLRPVEVASDYASTPTSGTGQPTHSSAAHLADVSSWQAFVPEPTEFCSLPGESVSDLLAEVEAMEALGRLGGSPTSSISCGGEFREFSRGTENDCFSPVEGFSPIPEQGKSDALSSTGDLKIPSRGTVGDESLGKWEQM
ncbi:zinc finger CCCH domain-containing protein 44-like isoform X2 [Tripterygium wilfordii]|uniref:zinc finger CCCH domain-containing protein 44-like isoform X2 n=1 Tax=Tripterygium wilfordii TaxID=458696 RepID=UPI0018F7EA3A|nr:zinc finger CCCH domain-containing protein 44-like isoform X2 [Tripterygium wilfordii]